MGKTGHTMPDDRIEILVGDITTVAVDAIVNAANERMLGGGDKGAAGALVKAEDVESLQRAVSVGYPRSCPVFADKYAVHTCKVVDGVKVFDNLDI